jgi:ATP-dependent helicase HrpA
VKDGLGLLAELGAIHEGSTKSVKLTNIGRSLSKLPMEPRFARMLIESKSHDLAREVMIIVAGLTIQDPRERPLAKREQADLMHARFADPTSDFLTLLNLWNHIEDQQKKLSASAFRRLCKAEHLNYLRVREWQDLIKQLRSIGKPLQLEVGNPKIDPDGIHRSILAGLLSQIGLKQLSDKKVADQQKSDGSKPARGSNEYLGSNGKKFVIFPGSALAKKPPAAIMSAELVETSRLFARMNASIDPAWAEKLGGDNCKSSYSEPHWEKSQGAVVAYERVMLFGVPIIASRRMQFSRIDAAFCRELFIRHALVQGEWDSKQVFDRNNRALIKQLEAAADRARKPALAPSEDDIFNFYHQRLPPEVLSTRTFEGWWKKAKNESPALLNMTREDLLGADVAKPEGHEHPDEWTYQGEVLKLQYRFDPSAPNDGATVVVPLVLLPDLNADAFDWLVPGMRRDLIAELIRSLPKSVRRYVVPVNDWAAKALAVLPAEPTGSLLTVLAKTLQQLSGSPVSANDFDSTRLPNSLRMSYRVVDGLGRTLGLSNDLTALQQKFAEQAQLTRAATVTEVEKRPQFTRADFIGLVKAAIASPAKYVEEHLSQAEKLAIASLPYPNFAAFIDDVIVALAEQTLRATYADALVFSPEQFESVRDQVSASIIDQAFQAAGLAAKIGIAAREAGKSISSVKDFSFLGLLATEKTHLEQLVPNNFVSAIGIERLPRLPIYLQAIKIRLEKLVENSDRDFVATAELNQAIGVFSGAGGQIPLPENASPKLVKARWLLEELRVSLYAQTLGTAEPASVQRIKKALE